MYPVVLRVETLKTYGNITCASKHNMRLGGDLSHVKPDVTHRNKLLAGSENATPVVRTLEKKYGKARKNSTLAFELVCGANQQYFASKNEAQIEAWARESLAFVQKRFGAESVAQAILHLDEEAPHMHFIIVPLAETVRKNRYKESRKMTINYSQVLGIPRGYYPKGTTADEKRTGVLQTEYAAAMAPFGLIRGVRNRKNPDGGKVENVSPREYRDRLAKELDDLLKRLEKIDSGADSDMLIISKKDVDSALHVRVQKVLHEFQTNKDALENRAQSLEQLLHETATVLGCPAPAKLPLFARDIAYYCSTLDITPEQLAVAGQEAREEAEQAKAKHEQAPPLQEDSQSPQHTDSARPARRIKGQRKTPEERRAARATRRQEAERDSHMQRIHHQHYYLGRENSHARNEVDANRPAHRTETPSSVHIRAGG